MNLYQTTKRLKLQVLPPYYYKQVLAFYKENAMHLEPWEAKRDKNFYTEKYQKALLEAEYNMVLKSKMFRFYTSLKEDPDRIMGSVSLTNIQRGAFMTCTIGYKIHENFCNQGYGKEAVSLVMKLAFEECGLHRIEAMVHPENEPSIRLLTSLGFKREGIAVSSAMLHGVWQDMYRYAVINPEQ